LEIVHGISAFDSRVMYYFSAFQNGLLGIFQKLIASRSNDHQGFYLLNTMVEHMPEYAVWLITKYH